LPSCQRLILLAHFFGAIVGLLWRTRAIMDELLSLFDCDDNNIVPHEEETYNDNDRDHSSLTTFDAASFSQQASSVRNHSSQQQQQQQHQQQQQQQPHQPQQFQQKDPLTGLRIVDRRTSHATLLDIYSNYIYAPCSVVAAASKSQWKTNYLISSTNAHEGGGKTQLATCGILTSDVYSQISPKTGKAFAILSLGSLPSSSSSSIGDRCQVDNTVRPSITVFLFGNALSTLQADTIKYMKVGYVVSVLGPNLLPPRPQQQQDGGNNVNSSSTAVTLSICDAKQIVHIGKAADCDRCKGTVRKRITNITGNSAMNNRWEDVRCSTLVDTRQFGGYCTVHRRQGLSSSSSSSNDSTKAGGITFMQRQRQESSSSRTTTTTTVAPPRVSGTKRPSPLMEALSKSGLLEPKIPTPTSIMMDASTKQLQHLSRAPMHMKKKMANEECARPVVVMTKVTSGVIPTTNPYTKKRMIDQSSLSTSGCHQKQRYDNEDILGNALEQLTKKRSRATQSEDVQHLHRRTTTKVFTVEGYDGSVQVPKPNAILFRSRTTEHAMRNNTVTPTPSSSSSLPSSVILERQRNLAELLKRQTPIIANDNKNSISQRLNESTNASSVKVGEFASTFGTIDDGIQQQSSLNDIANARSRFASAVDAQEYTRARAVIQALELREESSNGTKRTKKDSSQAKDAPRVAIVTAGWTCRTCQKVTQYKPTSCLRVDHDVRQRRELKDERGTKKSVTGLSSRKDQLMNEGLTLGSGLEWSGWRGGF